MITKLYLKAVCAKAMIKNRIADQKGEVNVVAIVVLIGIAVFLAIIFKGRIQQLLGNLFDSIDNSAKNAIK